MTKVSIRPLTGKDAAAFLTWAGDPAVTESLFWDAYRDEKTAKAFLEAVCESHEFFYAICWEGQPVGAVTLDRGKSPRAAHRAELGYVLAKAFWGRGIATAAVQLATARGFQKLALRRIEAFVDPDNVGSYRVLEKAGFKKEALLQKYVTHRGRLRDRLVFALVR